MHARKKFCALGRSKKNKNVDIDERRLCRLYQYFLLEYGERHERVGNDPALFLSMIIHLVRQQGVGYFGDLDDDVHIPKDEFEKSAEAFAEEYAENMLNKVRSEEESGVPPRRTPPRPQVVGGDDDVYSEGGYDSSF